MNVSFTALGKLGGPELEAAVSRLIPTLTPVLRTRFLEALVEIADELKEQISEAHLEDRVQGDDIELVYIEDGSVIRENPSDLNARITLGLPEDLKSRIESAATRKGEELMKFRETLQTAKEESFDIAHPEVSITSVSSEITLIESHEEKCHVKILADSNKAVKLAELVEIVAKGETLTVRVDKKSRSSWGISDSELHGLSIELALPLVSNVKIKTVSGDILISQSLTNVEIGAVSAAVIIS